MNIGFVGLGRMGRGVAANLKKAGHDLILHDRMQEAAAPLLDHGARWAETPRALAQDCAVVFTSLPKPADVQAVCDGPDGLAAGLKAGACWFDLTTNSLSVVRQLHDRLAENGVDFLDAPVSGGPGGAASGKLAIWVGGSAAAYEKHSGLLAQISDQPSYIGASGAGTIAKLAHNMASSAMKVLLGEVITMGVKAGLDPLTLWEAMRSGGAGRMRGFDNIQRFLTGQLDPASFAIELMQKDVGLALDLGKELDVPMRMCAMVGQDLSEAMNRGWQDRDSQALLELQRERAGVAEIRITPEDLRAVMARS